MAHPDRLVELLVEAQHEATYHLGVGHSVTDAIEALIRRVVLDQAQYLPEPHKAEMIARLLNGTEVAHDAQG